MIPITVIGMSDGGGASLPPAFLARILCADVLLGGVRHLQAFTDFKGETISIGGDLTPVIERLRRACSNGEQAVVLASGDPLCYGIGTTLRQTFGADMLEIIPAPSSFQLAFAALREPWHDAVLLSAHARPLDAVVRAASAAAKMAILTDPHHTPGVIAAALIRAGFVPETECAVCENLGGTGERVVRGTLARTADAAFAPLNIMIVWRAPLPQPIAPGLPDSAFITTEGQMTKREIRLLSLAELGLQAHHILWDIGAGSGAVGIEAARAQPTARVFAIEQRATFCAHIRANLEHFPAPNLHVIEGTAPEACQMLPAPDAVFVGGSGGRLTEILNHVTARLRPAGRLVMNVVTLDTLAALCRLLPDARFTQVQINRAVPLRDQFRFEPLNPVFMITWQKDQP